MKCSGVVSFFKSLTQLNRKEGKYFTLFIFFQIKAGLKIREQQRQVSKVLLDGLNDTGSPLSKLLGVQKEVFEEIIWQVGLTRLSIAVVTVDPCCPVSEIE